MAPRNPKLELSLKLGVRTRNLKLELNPTHRKRVRPNFILLCAVLIHLNTLGLPKAAIPCAPRRAPRFLRILRTRQDGEEVIGEEIHRAQGDQIAPKQQIR